VLAAKWFLVLLDTEADKKKSYILHLKIKNNKKWLPR